MSELLQVIGALLILIPYGCQQLGSMRSDARAYLWPNLVGSFLLAVLALRTHQWGFLLLESFWALIAARGIAVRARRSR